MRTVLKTLAALAVIGIVAGALVVSLGLYNVSARAGHLPGVSWVLHTTYRNAIRLRAPSADKMPDLTPAMAALGARHFDSACAFCHATPGTPRSATALAMVPRPPHITEAVKDWQPRHLFEIVRNGVKMSGMPHWPAPRKDEVWAVAAYLDTVRAGTTGPAPQIAGKPPLPYCAGCHDENGASDNTHIPRLDILSEDYMAETLLAYRDGRRASGFMEHAAREVSKAELRAMAKHYAGFATVPAPVSSGTAALPGAALATRGSDAVPACTGCHGAKPQYPAIAGQSQGYLAAQLRLWREGARGGGPRKVLMNKAAMNLSDGEIDALAEYFASLPAGR